ncbi:MAG: hypothetical protein D6781_13730 [Verrucomicrobia bacterium]|nr:MAG: hypothetical protein D6781_13730 [Verrucomicrobiota bacterium]
MIAAVVTAVAVAVSIAEGAVVTAVAATATESQIGAALGRETIFKTKAGHLEVSGLFLEMAISPTQSRLRTPRPWLEPG